eukprot:1934085-Rhodomonas_salina.2
MPDISHFAAAYSLSPSLPPSSSSSLSPLPPSSSSSSSWPLAPLLSLRSTSPDANVIRRLVGTAPFVPKQHRVSHVSYAPTRICIPVLVLTCAYAVVPGDDLYGGRGVFPRAENAVLHSRNLCTGARATGNASMVLRAC